MGGVGGYRHRVAVEGPGAAIPDGDGGYYEGWAPLDPPEWDCLISQASTHMRDLERLVGASAVLSQATHVVRGNYHAAITTKARLQFQDAGRQRTLNVVYVANRDERNEETDLICAEVVE